MSSWVACETESVISLLLCALHSRTFGCSQSRLLEGCSCIVHVPFNFPWIKNSFLCVKCIISEVSKIFVTVFTWSYKNRFVNKYILLKYCSSSDHSSRVTFLDATLTWFPTHIEIGFCFLSGWMECEISSAFFLLLCTQSDFRLFPRQTEGCWFFVHVQFNLAAVRNVFCVCSASCC